MLQLLKALVAQREAFTGLSMVAFGHFLDYDLREPSFPQSVISLRVIKTKVFAAVPFKAQEVLTVEALNDTNMPDVRMDLAVLTDRLINAVAAQQFYPHTGPPWCVIHSQRLDSWEYRIGQDQRRQILLYWVGDASWKTE